MQRKWPSDASVLRVSFCGMALGGTSFRGGRRGRERGGLQSGSRNLLSLASPPSSHPPFPPFPLSRMWVKMTPLVPDVNPILLPSGLEHAAVTDRDPVSQEHKGACYPCLRHAGVRPQGPRQPALPSHSWFSAASPTPHPQHLAP